MVFIVFKSWQLLCSYIYLITFPPIQANISVWFIRLYFRIAKAINYYYFESRDTIWPFPVFCHYIIQGFSEIPSSC